MQSVKLQAKSVYNWLPLMEVVGCKKGNTVDERHKEHCGHNF